MARLNKAQELEATVTVIRRLARERKDDLDAVTMAKLTKALKDEGLDLASADNVARWLLSVGQQPVAAATTSNGRGGRKAPDVTTPGLYEKDDVVYLVQHSADGTRSYALKFIPGARKELDMASGVIYDLTPAHQITAKREIDKLCASSARLASSYKRAISKSAA